MSSDHTFHYRRFKRIFCFFPCIKFLSPIHAAFLSACLPAYLTTLYRIGEKKKKEKKKGV